jgi:hypothetical protein
MEKEQEWQKDRVFATVSHTDSRRTEQTLAFSYAGVRYEFAPNVEYQIPRVVAEYLRDQTYIWKNGKGKSLVVKKYNVDIRDTSKEAKKKAEEATLDNLDDLK